MKNKTTPAQQVTPAHFPESFAERYQALCKETGFQIVFEPRWAQSKDQGDYRLVIVASIALMPKE